MKIKKYIMVLALPLIINISQVGQVKAQIITNDPILNAQYTAQSIIDYVEQFAQTITQLEIAGLELSEWNQMWIEWQHLLDQAMSLKERLGADAWDGGLAMHEAIWGSTPLTSALRDFNAGSPEAFVAMTYDLFEDYLGGQPVEDINGLLTYLQSPENKANAEKEISIRNERDKVFRESVVGSTNANQRNILYRDQLEDIKSQGNALGNNSELATLQYNNKVMVFMAQQQLENQELLSMMFGNSQQGELMDNMDEIQQLKEVHEAKRDYNDNYQAPKFKNHLLDN